jgi:hypothetical protein
MNPSGSYFRAAMSLAFCAWTLASCGQGSGQPASGQAQVFLTVTTPSISVTVGRSGHSTQLKPPYAVRLRTNDRMELDLISNNNLTWAQQPNSSDQKVLARLSTSSSSSPRLTQLYDAMEPGTSRLEIVLPCSFQACAAMAIFVSVNVTAELP